MTSVSERHQASSGGVWRALPLYGVLSLLAMSLLVSPSVVAGELPGEREAWIEVKTPNFLIVSNANQATAVQAGVDLERFREALERIFEGNFRSPIPTGIFVFKNDRSFRKYKHLYEGKPASVSGYFLPTETGNYVAIDGSKRKGKYQPTRIVYHEFLHELIRHDQPNLPLWLNEGLAEFYSTFEASDEQVKIGLAIENHVQWLRSHELMPLEQLLTVDRDSEHYNDRKRNGVFYAQSWALTHYLYLGSPERRGQVERYAALIDSGVSSRRAFNDAFATDYETLGDELERYVRGSRFAYLPLAVATNPIEPEVRQLARYEVLYRLGDLLAQLGDELQERSKAHLLGAVTLEPDHPPSLASLAMLGLQGGDKTALAQLSHAANLAHDDFRIQYLYGKALLGTIVAPGESVNPESLDDAARLAAAQARNAFARSVNQRADFSDAWAKLSLASQLAKRPEEEVLQVLETAHRLLPNRSDVAANYVRALSNAGRSDKARSLAVVLQERATDIAARTLARDLLFYVDYEDARTAANDGRVSDAISLVRHLAGRDLNPAQRVAVDRLTEFLEARQ